jgi:hypothetical protein
LAWLAHYTSQKTWRGDGDRVAQMTIGLFAVLAALVVLILSNFRGGGSSRR